jgi:hypothetical protein
MLVLTVIPPLWILGLLPWMWLVTPPALVIGRPLFRYTEVGYQPDSGWAILAALAFWIAVCALLAAFTAWLARNAPEPVPSQAEAPPPPAPAEPEPAKHYPPAIQVIVCPACRATNVPSGTCFRCGAPLP